VLSRRRRWSSLQTSHVPRTAHCTDKPNWPESIVQNEPNSAGWPGLPRQKCAKRTQDGGIKCAKRTQLPPVSLAPGAIVQNEAKLGRDRVSGQRLIPHEGTFTGKWNAQNEPNSRRTGYPPFHYSIVPHRRRLCKTKPISALTAERDASFCFIHPLAAATLGGSTDVFSHLWLELIDYEK